MMRHTPPNAHDIAPDAPDATHDVDTPFYAVMEARSMRPRLHRDQWHSLKPDDRTAWDRLSDDGKRVILGTTSANSPPSRPARRTPRPPTSRRVNLADLSSDEHAYLSAQLHELREGSIPSDSPDAHDDAHENDFQEAVSEEAASDHEADAINDQLYAMMMRKRDARNKQPGNVTRLLSKSSAKKN